MDPGLYGFVCSLLKLSQIQSSAEFSLTCTWEHPLPKPTRTAGEEEGERLLQWESQLSGLLLVRS